MKSLYPRVLLLLLLLGPLSRQASAQVFEPGYLVLSRGDTLRGEVENAFWTDPPKTVRFRRNASGPLVAYRAAQLRAVQLTSGRLLRHELLPIDYSAVQRTNQASYGYVIRQQPDSVLADVLVEGPASLLSVVWNQTHHYFVRREGKPYLEMTERRYIDNYGPQVRAVDGNNYRGQLEIYFGDCAPALEVSRRAQFVATDLAEVVQSYNLNCSASRQVGRRIEVTAPKVSRTKVQVGPMLGVGYNSLRLHSITGPGLENRPLEDAQLDGQVHLQPGIFFDVLEGGRRLAVHTALFGYRFGRTVQLPAPDAAGQWRGTVTWRGTNATLQMGLRGLQPVGTRLTLLGGAGAEIAHVWGQNTLLRYGNGQASRNGARNVQLATETPFEIGYGTDVLPYAEVGIRHSRLTASVTGRLYPKYGFYDPLVVNSTVDVNGTTVASGYNYTGRILSLSLVLAFRLNGDPDQRAAR